MRQLTTLGCSYQPIYSNCYIFIFSEPFCFVIFLNNTVFPFFYHTLVVISLRDNIRLVVSRYTSDFKIVFRTPLNYIIGASESTFFHCVSSRLRYTPHDFSIITSCLNIHESRYNVLMIAMKQNADFNSVCIFVRHTNIYF